jgi:hypothetical protein
LPSGDPKTAKLAIILETPANEDVGFHLDPVRDILDSPRDEVLRRQRLYPELEKSFLIKGLPAIGRQGSILNNWLLPKVGVRRADVYVTTVLRCVPPRNKQMKPYPTGNDRFVAERTCRQYDRLAEFAPTAIVITFAPHELVREITPLPLVIKDLEKAAAFVSQGHRVLLLMGGKATELYLGWGSNVARSRGDYVIVGDRYGSVDAWYDRVLARASSRVKAKRKSRAKQLAAGMSDFASPVGPDVLDVVAKRKRKPPVCKFCQHTKAEHPVVALCGEFVSGRKKKTTAAVVA